MPTNPDLRTGVVAVDNSSHTAAVLTVHRMAPSDKGGAGQSSTQKNSRRSSEIRSCTASPFTAVDRPGRPMRKGGFSPVPRHSAPPRTARRQSSPRATAVLWAALAALAVVGLASVPPAAAAARLTDTRVSTAVSDAAVSDTAVSTAGGAQAAVPAPLVAPPGNSTAQAIPALTGTSADAATGAYRSSSFATGFPDGRAASAMRGRAGPDRAALRLGR